MKLVHGVGMRRQVGGRSGGKDRSGANAADDRTHRKVKRRAPPQISASAQSSHKTPKTASQPEKRSQTALDPPDEEIPLRSENLCSFKGPRPLDNKLWLTGHVFSAVPYYR